MPAWKYYEAERKRHPDLHDAKVDDSVAILVIHKLTRHFIRRKGEVNARGRAVERSWPNVKFTKGDRCSYGNCDGVILNADHLSMLLVVHEFAHLWQERRLYCAGCRYYHCSHHRILVDEAAEYIRKNKMTEGDIRATKKELRYVVQQLQAEVAGLELEITFRGKAAGR